MPEYRLISPAPTLTKGLEWSNKVSELITGPLRPWTAAGAEKVRIGGDGDGGYVSLDPGRAGIAYSFGVSAHSPWDLEMAERGFTVHQYDGTIEKGPYQHPNIHFHRFNIGAAPAGGVKTIGHILDDLGHRKERNIVLQMDIEGAEWDFFEAATVDEMAHFQQIIVEFHGVDPRHRDFNRFAGILARIRETHTPVHIHCNNWDPCIGFMPGFVPYSSFYEMTYARTADYAFAECRDFFPTPLDRPNNPQWPDIVIGMPHRIA